MKPANNSLTRRKFIAATGAAVAGAMITRPGTSMIVPGKESVKKRIALVGTGIRGTTFWGRRILENYSDLIDFVGLCDINPGRVEFAKKYMNANCPTFTDFDEMMMKTKPDLLIVTTVDATHHEFIIKGLEMGIDVLTEKPMTTDEVKCQKILDAERKSGKKLIVVGFNYRYGPHPTMIKEMLVSNEMGNITSVDFHWYLNVYHGILFQKMARDPIEKWNPPGA